MNRKSVSLRVKYIFSGIALLLCVGLSSCGSEKKENVKPQVSEVSEEYNGQICEIPEQLSAQNETKEVENAEAATPATYPGGEKALKDFIKKNIVFADAKKAKQYKGVIPVRFKVKEDGSLGQFTLEETISPECDHALIEAVKKVKGFTAATDKDGKAQAAWWTVKIEFPIK